LNCRVAHDAHVLCCVIVVVLGLAKQGAIMRREHIMGLTSLALIGWGAFLMYDMMKLQETPEFQQKVKALEEQRAKLRESRR
jgi:hypothetical protein